MEKEAFLAFEDQKLNKWENMYKRNSSWDKKWQDDLEKNEIDTPKLSIFSKSQKSQGKIF